MGPVGEDGVMVALWRDKWWEFNDQQQRVLRANCYLGMRRPTNRERVKEWVENEMLMGASDRLEAYEQALGINGWKEPAVPIH